MATNVSSGGLPINIPLLESLLNGLIDSGGVPITAITIPDNDDNPETPPVNTTATITNFHFSDGDKEGFLNLTIIGEDLTFVGKLDDDHQPIPHVTRLGGTVNQLIFSGGFGKDSDSDGDETETADSKLFHDIPVFPHEDHGTLSSLTFDFTFAPGTGTGSVPSSLTFDRLLGLLNSQPAFIGGNYFASLPQFLDGTNSADILSGGSNTDVIKAFGGADLVDGNDGDDVLALAGGSDTGFGGKGDDTLYGVGGNDWLLGEAGDDVAFGQAGHDSLLGGSGDDSLSGLADSDAIDGGDGDDTILGGADDDILFGADGDDSMLGGNDDDTIDGGAGEDTVNGQNGDDLIGGGEGADLLIGGEGADVVAGGLHDDVLQGHGGEDSLYGDFGHLFGTPPEPKEEIEVNKELLTKISKVPSDFVFFNGFEVLVETLDGPTPIALDDLVGLGTTVEIDGPLSPADSLEEIDALPGRLPDGSVLVQVANGFPLPRVYVVDPEAGAPFEVTVDPGQSLIINVGTGAPGSDIATVEGPTGIPNILPAPDGDVALFQSTLLADEHLDLSLDPKFGLDSDHLTLDAAREAFPDIDVAPFGGENLIDLLGISDYDDNAGVPEGFERIDTVSELYAFLLEGGNDFITANGDDDYLDGGGGNDSLTGDNGEDTLIGGTGSDNINGGGDDDRLVGDVDFIKFIPEDKHAVFQDSLLPPGQVGKDKTVFAGADDFIFNGTNFGDDVVVDFQVGIDLLRVVNGFTRADIEDAEFVSSTVFEIDFENAAGDEASIRLENLSSDPSDGPLFNPDVDLVFF